MRLLKTFVFSMLAVLCFSECDNDKGILPTAVSTGSCIIQNETNGLVGNEASWQYQYDDKGNPTMITKFNRYGSPESTLEIFYDGLVSTRGTNIIKTSYDADIHQARLPSKAQVSITMDGVEQRNYWTYFFFYDEKDRLVKVGEQTDYVPNDWEYDVSIFYNEQNNVTQLLYERTTGPRDPIPPVTVTAYDDKPSPYAAVKSWKFLMNNYAWDNYDPAPILTALSTNNPLDYTSGSGMNTFTRKMSYKYNSEGFPVECSNTNKNANGEYTFIQTFSYTCK